MYVHRYGTPPLRQRVMLTFIGMARLRTSLSLFSTLASAILQPQCWTALDTNHSSFKSSPLPFSLSLRLLSSQIAVGHSSCDQTSRLPWPTPVSQRSQRSTTQQNQPPRHIPRPKSVMTPKLLELLLDLQAGCTKIGSSALSNSPIMLRP